jgi:hypothetical protein
VVDCWGCRSDERERGKHRRHDANGQSDDRSRSSSDSASPSGSAEASTEVGAASPSAVGGRRSVAGRALSGVLPRGWSSSRSAAALRGVGAALHALVHMLYLADVAVQGLDRRLQSVHALAEGVEVGGQGVELSLEFGRIGEVRYGVAVGQRALNRRHSRFQ